MSESMDKSTSENKTQALPPASSPTHGCPCREDEAYEKLTCKQKELIREYMLRVVGIGGSMVSVIVFFLGFAIRDIALGKAENTAMVTTHNETRELVKQVALLEAQLLASRKELSASQKELDDVGSRIKEAKALLVEFEKSNDARAMSIIVELGKQPESVNEMLKMFVDIKKSVQPVLDGKISFESDGGIIAADGLVRITKIDGGAQLAVGSGNGKEAVLSGTRAQSSMYLSDEKGNARANIQYSSGGVNLKFLSDKKKIVEIRSDDRAQVMVGDEVKVDRAYLEYRDDGSTVSAENIKK